MADEMGSEHGGAAERRTRLRLVADGESAEVDTFFSEVAGAGRQVPNLQRALAHSPELLRAMAGMGEAVRFSHDLPVDQLELAILRLAILARCPYPYAHHVPIAQRAGLSDEQIASVAGWQGASCYDEAQRLVLQAADDIASQAGLSEATFARLAAVLSEREVLELVMALSFYSLLVRVVNSLGVPVDDRVRSVIDAGWPVPAAVPGAGA